MNRIALESELWKKKEYYIEIRDQVKSWTSTILSKEELDKFIDTGCACSDGVYDVFFYALPYFLDEFAKQKPQDKIEIGYSLTSSVVKALTEEYSEICNTQMDNEKLRISTFLFENISSGRCSEKVLKSHLAAIAALSSCPELANAIAWLDY